MLNAIYEEDLGFSYGFRPGRGPHDASDALATAISSRKVNFILDADVRDLRQVVTGHFAYYAVPSNARALSAFRHYVTDLWRRTA